MKVVALVIGVLWAVLPVQAQAEAAPVPSGQPVTFHDVIRDTAGPGGTTLRFRFIAPDIARGGAQPPFDTVMEDMAYLCENFAVPRVAQSGPIIGQIIISLSDRVVEFGALTPEATQYFEAFRIENEKCIWEGL